jgi:hypothetical protein
MACRPRQDRSPLRITAAPPVHLDGGSLAEARRHLNLSQKQFTNSVTLRLPAI